MRITGLGTDIVEIARVSDLLAAHGDRFLRRCFTSAERQYFTEQQRGSLAGTVAGRWAAKEAFLKALRGEIRHIPYQQIGVRREASGAPSLELTGQAAVALTQGGGQRVLLSISHERAYAVATVVIEG